MTESLCEVCGEPGIVQGAPGAPYSGCWCSRHAPGAKSPILTILNTLLFLLLLVGGALWLWRRFTR